MEEQKINKKITFSIIAVLLIVLVAIGATYAYFSAQGTTGTQTVTTGTLTMNFDKEGSVVTVDGIIPIKDSEIKTKAAAFPFSVTNTGTEHMNITIKLKDIAIDPELKNIDFRWGLYNADTNKGISFGIFKYASNGGEEIIYRDSIIDAGSSKKNYVLRIWIHDNNQIQNEMQGKTFNGKIEVTGTAVEYTDESCFTFSNGSITDYDAATCGTDVVIPRTIGGVVVTGIGDPFGLNSLSSKGLTSVIIPDSVTAIQSYALNNNQLTHLTIPTSLTWISSEAINNNPLSSLIIPEGLRTTVYDSFANNKLTTFIFSGETLGETMLSGNPVTDVVLMDGVKAIVMLGLSNIKMTTIEIPSSVNEIEAGAFNSNPNLTEIVVRGKNSIDDFVCTGEYSLSGTGAECVPGLTTEGGLPAGVNVIYRP